MLVGAFDHYAEQSDALKLRTLTPPGYRRATAERFWVTTWFFDLPMYVATTFMLRYHTRAWPVLCALSILIGEEEAAGADPDHELLVSPSKLAAALGRSGLRDERLARAKTLLLAEHGLLRTSAEPAPEPTATVAKGQRFQTLKFALMAQARHGHENVRGPVKLHALKLRPASTPQSMGQSASSEAASGALPPPLPSAGPGTAPDGLETAPSVSEPAGNAVSPTLSRDGPHMAPAEAVQASKHVDL